MFSVACAFLIGALVTEGQLPTATISGVVKDPSGAVIPRVAVTVTNVETGLTRSSETSNDGSYRFPALPVGNYTLRVEQSGFSSQVRSGLTLTVGQEAVINFSLEVGSIAQTVEVTGSAPLVNTTSGSLGGLVDEKRMSDLPLNGRNYNDLTLLQTGVSRNRYSAGSLNGIVFSSNGAPIRSNLFMMDGTIMNDANGSGAASSSGNTLGVEGIREFRVVTNAFSAEYGLTMGSQITLVTKGGTNELHGSLFEYLRNSALDARNWTDIPDKPPFRRNNFGGAVGGPIRHDKVFYFLTYEGVRESRSVTLVGTFPTAAARQDGGLVPKIAESVKPYLNFYPLPPPDAQDLGQGLARVFTPVNFPKRDDFGQGRIDFNLSNNDTLFARFTRNDSERVEPQNIPPLQVAFPGANHWTTLSENHIFTPRLLATFRASFSRTVALRVPTYIKVSPALAFQPNQALGSLGISGLSSLYSTETLVNNQRIISFGNDMFYTRGRHSLKFGTLINLYRLYLTNARSARGSWSFSNLAAFLEARPTSFVVFTPGSNGERTYDYDTLGFYLQDDLRVTPTFTLNLGLRYEFTTQYEEIRGLGSAIRDIQHDAAATLGIPFRNPSKRNIGPRFGFAWDVMGDGKTAVRGGFALLYDVGGMSSGLAIQASGTPPFSSQSTVTPANGLVFGPNVPIPAGLAGKDLRTVDYNIQQPHLLSYNLTMDRQLLWDMGLMVAYAGSRGFNILASVEGNPTVPQGTPAVVNGQRTCLNVSPPPAFVANGPKCWTGTEPRTNPNWGTTEFKTGGYNSWYNSLQVGLQKRLSRGLQFQSSYTWSHALDEAQGQYGTDGQSGGDDTPDRRYDKASAAFDLRHNWKFNTIYRFPSSLTGRWGKLANGWWTSGILTWNSGVPFHTSMTTQRSRSVTRGPNGGDKRPDLVAGIKAEDITRGTSRGCLGVPEGTPLGTPQLFYDPCAFAIPPLGFAGNSGRNILYGPNYSELNFSLVKDTALPMLGESGSLQFRAEIFNLLNHPSLTIPSGTVFTALSNVEPPRAGAGQITGTYSKSRDIQFALKIVF